MTQQRRTSACFVYFAVLCTISEYCRVPLDLCHALLSITISRPPQRDQLSPLCRMLYSIGRSASRASDIRVRASNGIAPGIGLWVLDSRFAFWFSSRGFNRIAGQYELISSTWYRYSTLIVASLKLSRRSIARLRHEEEGEKGVWGRGRF